MALSLSSLDSARRARERVRREPVCATLIPVGCGGSESAPPFARTWALCVSVVPLVCATALVWCAFYMYGVGLLNVTTLVEDR